MGILVGFSPTNIFVHLREKQMDKQVRYLPDLTAKNLNNKVEKERHHLKRQIKNRIIVPIYGCFYKEKLIVKDVFNKKFLKHGRDYFLGGYRPQYSKYADGEVYSFIVINNDKVSESIEISYQAYGVAAVDNSIVTAKLLEDNFSTYDIVPYNKIKNLPKDFTPSLHYHDIGDIKEFQLLLFYLDQIRFCILADNKELYAYLAKIESSIEAIMERALNNYDDLVYQKIKKYYDDFSLAMFGLDKVKNYPLMNFEDGFTIGDKTHSKMFSDLGEKYFSLKALEGLSKGIYSTLVNIEKTHLGYFKETTVVPSVEFLESLVIGASITIPRLDSIEITEEIKKLYPDLEVKDCRYLVKKVSNRVGNKNSCYVYIHRDSGRTYVMVGYMQNNEYKTIFYKIASSIDGEVIINNINKHILDYDNPHLDDKRDVDLSKVENLPIATKEDIICNLPVRKYITLRNLLLFMKRFKTGTKNVTEIYEQLSPRSEARLMQTIFSACGSWKNIDPNKIELCRVIQKEEDPWIYISESTTQMWEGDEVLIFTISCSDHYVNKTFVYKLVLDSTVIFTDALTIPLAQALEENFSQEFERWTREVSIPESEGMTEEELIFKTFVKTFITLPSNSTQVIFRTNFRQNPVFRSVELYENGAEVPTIVPVKKEPVKVKFNLYNFDEASDSIKDLIANSNHVTIKPDPSALEILINKQDGGLLSCFFKIITDNFSTDWMSGFEFDWHLSQGRFKFLPTDPLDESGELFLENGLFVNLANFRDDASGSKQTDKVKIEIRAGWVYNGGWEEEGSINYGTLPLKIKVRSTTGGYKNMDLLTTIQELNRTTPVVDVGEQEPMTLNASNVNENTKAICRVEYDMQTRLIEIINYSDQTTSSTTTTTTTTTTSTTSTSTTSTTTTTTTTTRPPTSTTTTTTTTTRPPEKYGIGGFYSTPPNNLIHTDDTHVNRVIFCKEALTLQDFNPTYQWSSIRGSKNSSDKLHIYLKIGLIENFGGNLPNSSFVDGLEITHYKRLKTPTSNSYYEKSGPNCDVNIDPVTGLIDISINPGSIEIYNPGYYSGKEDGAIGIRIRGGLFFNPLSLYESDNIKIVIALVRYFGNTKSYEQSGYIFRHYSPCGTINLTDDNEFLYEINASKSSDAFPDD